MNYDDCSKVAQWVQGTRLMKILGIGGSRIGLTIQSREHRQKDSYSISTIEFINHMERQPTS